MSLIFWKRKPVETKRPEPRRLIVPADKVRHIMELEDAYRKAPLRQDRVAKYDLWSAIAEIFPEIKDGNWKLRFPDALTVEVVKQGR